MTNENRKRPFRLGCALPYAEDGTSYHRAMGPLNAMLLENNNRPAMELVFPRREGKGWMLTWDWVGGCDAIFMQRPATPVYLQLGKLIKAMGKPLWIDWDDDYLCIPVSNSCFSEYDPQVIRPLVKELSWLADVITVATPELGRRIPKASQSKVVLIPNAAMPVYRAKEQNFNPFFNEERQRRVSWRGTDTHDEDVSTILPALAEVSRRPQFGKWLWHFSGGMPWQVHDAIPRERLEQSPFCGPVFFLPMLSLFAPFVHLCPLKCNAFNLCKSNLAWIEATCAGAVVMAPEAEEWMRPGIVNYTDRKDFAEKLTELLNQWDGGKLHPSVALSRKYIEENLMLEQVNVLRWSVIAKLMAKSLAYSM